MQIVRKYPARVIGDSVAGLSMILQVPLTLLLITFFVLGVGFKLFSLPLVGKYLILAGLSVLGLVLAERFVFASRVFKKQRDIATFLLPFIHLLRNIAWCWAFLKWVAELQLIKPRAQGSKLS